MASKYVMAVYDMTLNGSDLTTKQRSCINAVNIMHSSKGADTMTVNVTDPDFVYINDDIFVDDVSITADVYFLNNNTKDSFSGFISAIDITFPEDGNPTLVLNCIDETYRMTRGKKKRSWTNITSAAVVQAIAAEYGYQCVTEAGYAFETQETVAQDNTTDADFIDKLAQDEIEDFMFKLVGNTLYYVKHAVIGEPSTYLYYRSNDYSVKSFSPQINKETKKVESKADVITPATKAKDSASVAGGSEGSASTSGGQITPDSQKNMKYNNKTGKWSEV